MLVNSYRYSSHLYSSDYRSFSSVSFKNCLLISYASKWESFGAYRNPDWLSWRLQFATGGIEGVWQSLQTRTKAYHCQIHHRGNGHSLDDGFTEGTDSVRNRDFHVECNYRSLRSLHFLILEAAPALLPATELIGKKKKIVMATASTKPLRAREILKTQFVSRENR